eukprot:9771795-Ditylum_brightwellii.AAC.1
MVPCTMNLSLPNARHYGMQSAQQQRQSVQEMGHPQQLTETKLDNKTVNLCVHAFMLMKQSKSWNMPYHWLREATTTKMLEIYWDQGINNNEDCFTKHHPPSHHKTQHQ